MAPTKTKAGKAPSKVEVNTEDFDEEDGKPGCIYLGHIPHGFYEDQMYSYFSQFGHVFGVKLCRSSKTNNSKGYGFIKFKYAAVAKTVAETCHNYLFFNKLLKCEYKPLSEVHKRTFKKYTWRPKTAPKRTFNSVRTEEKLKTKMEKTISKSEKKLKALKKRIGTDIDLNDIMDVPAEFSTAKESTELSENVNMEESVTPPKKRKRLADVEPDLNSVKGKENKESPAVKSPAVKSPAAKSPAAKSPAVKSPAVKSPAVKSPAVKSTAAKSPAAKSPAAKSPAVKSPAVKSPAVKFPAVKSPKKKTPKSEESSAKRTKVATPLRRSGRIRK